MEQNMNEGLAKFCKLLSKYFFCEEKLDEWKIHPNQLKRAFHSLDTTRKGSLDVTDLFRNFPDFNQEDLFNVYKALDFTRSGSITLNDLVHIMSREDSKENTNQKDHLLSIKFYIKIMQMNYQQIEKTKRELGMDQNTLMKIFYWVTGTKCKQIQASDLTTLFSKHTDKKFNNEIVHSIMDKIFHGQPMKMKDFVQYFRPFSWNQISQALQQSNQQSLQPTKSIENSRTNFRNLQNHSSQIEVRMNSIVPQQSKADTEWNNDRRSQITNNLAYIEKRREQLRKGSLERQKIIKNMLAKRNEESNQYPQRINSDLPRSEFGDTSKIYEPQYLLQRSISSQNIYKNSINNFGSKDSYNHWVSPKNELESRFYRKEPELKKYSQTMSRGELRRDFNIDKENIIRRAEQAASRKIEEIERNARMKVMEKRSALNTYSNWLN